MTKKLKKDQNKKAVIKIQIKDEQDIIINKIIKRYEEEKIGNEEIAMLQDKYF